MNSQIRNIFIMNKDSLNFSSKSIAYFRMQNIRMALRYYGKLIDLLVKSVDDIISQQQYFNQDRMLYDAEGIRFTLESLMRASEKKDYVLLTDLLEIQLNPFIISLQETIINKEGLVYDEDLYKRNLAIIQKHDAKLGKQLQLISNPLSLVENGYSIEHASCGLMTLALTDEIGKYYLHSNMYINNEAFIIAREWFSDEVNDYVVYGLGLGYHIIELLEIDNNIKIKVYESDINVIALACTFVDIGKLINTNQVELHYDPDFRKLSDLTKTLDDDTKYIIHYPSLRNISIPMIREQLEDYFISYSSVRNQKHKLNQNFRFNILRNDQAVDILKDEFYNKELIIVAAGPSLDKNYMLLKQAKNKAIIMATGTVLKKLISAGIVPDYVIIIDPNNEVYPQVEGIENSVIPLIYLSTTYYKIPENYQGKKYIIYQSGYKKAEEYAQKHGFELFQTGGSVSTIAIDLGIHFHCKKIITIGLDLAYTNGCDHASGIYSFNTVKKDNMRLVKDINGNMISTGKNLDIYRKWIEKHISGISDIEFYNATEGGANINGMRNVKFSDII